MEVIVWADYLCPWCYLGLPLWDHLVEQHGATVEWRPYELHPEIPFGGVAFRGPRAGMEGLLEEAGLPYRRPERAPNTHVALEASLWVQANQPELFGDFHRLLYDVHWVEGGDIGDPGTLVTLAAVSGVDTAALAASLQRGEHVAAVDQSKADAVERGVSGTPAWLLAGRLLIPGTQAKETLDATVERLKAKGLA